MAISIEDKYLILGLRKNKQYSAKRLKSEFPHKQWSLRGLNYLLKKIDLTGTIDRRPGSGRRHTLTATVNIARVEELVLSQENEPGTHKSQRQIARDTGLSRRRVRDIIKVNLGLKCLKRRKAQKLTDANKLSRLTRSKKLLQRYSIDLVKFIWFTDEKIFSVEPP